jgi:hypothetical protein
VAATWPPGQQPKIHYSSQRREPRLVARKNRKTGERVMVEAAAATGQHADDIDAAEFAAYLASVRDIPFDIMLEAKNKDLALLKLRADLAAMSLPPRRPASPCRSNMPPSRSPTRRGSWDGPIAPERPSGLASTPATPPYSLTKRRAHAGEVRCSPLSRMLNPSHTTGGDSAGRSRDRSPIVELLDAGSFDARTAATLWLLIEARASIIVAAGPSAAGKTTTLSALADFLPPAVERRYLRGGNETFGWRATAHPARTYLLCNEISPHLPVYLWGIQVGRLFAAAEAWVRLRRDDARRHRRGGAGDPRGSTAGDRAARPRPTGSRPHPRRGLSRPSPAPSARQP